MNIDKPYPFFVRPKKPNKEVVKERIDQLGRRLVTVPPDPESDFYLITAVAPFNSSEEILDGIQLIVRRWIKKRPASEIIKSIGSIWGSLDLYEIIERVVKTRWELADDCSLVAKNLGGGIYSVNHERSVLIAAIMNALESKNNSDIGRWKNLNSLKDRLIDIFVKSLRVVWSDIIEQMKIRPLFRPIMDLPGVQPIRQRETRERNKLVIPDVTEEILCPAYRKILKGVPEGIRDYSAFAVVTLLRELGVPKEKAKKILIEWNKLNKPPLDEKDIIDKVEYHYENEYTPPSCEWIFTHCRIRGAPLCPENCKYKHPFAFIRKKAEVNE